MISLLPSSNKKQLLASRSNTLLLRYIIVIIALIIFLLAEMTVVFFLLSSSQEASRRTIEQNNAKAAGLAQVEKDATQFRTDLATAKSIIDKQVPYTEILKNISDLVPAGVVLDRISINPTSFGTSETITIKAKEYTQILQAKDAFHDSAIFSDTNIQTITDNSDEKSAYKFTGTLNVTFRKDLATTIGGA